MEKKKRKRKERMPLYVVDTVGGGRGVTVSIVYSTKPTILHLYLLFIRIKWRIKAYESGDKQETLYYCTKQKEKKHKANKLLESLRTRETCTFTFNLIEIIFEMK